MKKIFTLIFFLFCLYVGDAYSGSIAVNFLTSLTPSEGSLSPSFTTSTMSYTLSVPSATDKISFSCITTNNSAITSIQGISVKSGQSSGDIPLAFGDNIIVINTVYIGNSRRVYKVVVNRESLSNIDTLSNMTLSIGSLSPNFSPSTTSYLVSVPNGTSNIAITPATTDSNATVKINGVPINSGATSASIPLSVGNNTITTTVTAQDGVTSLNYELMVNRASSNIATLSNLVPSTSSLSPGFSSGTTGYSVSVENNIGTIVLNPSATDPTATIKVNGVSVNSGSPSGVIGLSVGNNVITTVVTAQDGVTTQTYSVTVNRKPSSVAALSNLIPSTSSLQPSFSSGLATYSISVPNGTNSISLTPIMMDGTGTVKVNGASVVSGTASAPISLDVGNNTIVVVGTAQDGVATSRYTVTVNRASSSVATLSNLTPSQGNLSPGFSPLTTSYLVSVPNVTTNIALTPVATDSAATVKVNGVAINSGATSAGIPLSVGNNTVTTTVTAQDGVTTQTYSVTVNRAASSVATLSNLIPSQSSLSPVFSPATFGYSTSVPNSTTNIALTPSATDANATIKVNGSIVASGITSADIPLSVGNNTIITQVTAQDGISKQTYTVTVNRAPSSNALLSDLISSSGGLSPAFSSALGDYSVLVSNATGNFKLTAFTADSGATVKINGVLVNSGVQSPLIPLNIGINNVPVVVTAQDGVTSKTYTVTVSRTPNTVTGLTATQGTVVNGVTLTWPSDTTATGYQIWRATSPTATPTLLTTLTKPVFSYTDTKTSGVTQYYYSVNTVVGPVVGPSGNQAGGWADLAPISANLTILSNPVTPSQPTVATVVDPNSTAGQPENFNFSVTSQPSVGAVQYTNAGFVYTPPTTLTDLQLDQIVDGNLTFQYTVADRAKAVLVATGQVNVLPVVPLSITATQGTQYGQVTIRWSTTQFTNSYQIYRSTTLGTPGTLLSQGVVGTSYVDKTNQEGGQYFYSVKSVGAIGVSDYSDQAQGWAKVPKVINNLTATQGTELGKVVLNWGTDVDATGYQIWRATSGTATPVLLATLTSPVFTYTDSNVTGVNQYDYSVNTVVNSQVSTKGNLAQGWADVGPSSASVPTITTNSVSMSQPVTPAVIDPNLAAGEPDTMTFAISQQPEVGAVSIVKGQFIYTPSDDGFFSGHLNYGFSATDKAGAMVEGQGGIVVTCDNTVINNFQSASTNVSQMQTITTNANYTVLNCAKDPVGQVDILDSSNNVVAVGAPVTLNNGLGLVQRFENAGVTKPGSYTLRLTITSSAGQAVQSSSIVVLPVNLPSIEINPDKGVNTATTLQVSLKPPTQRNCEFSDDRNAVIADNSLCYVSFTDFPKGLLVDTRGVLPLLTGDVLTSGQYSVTADVSRADNLGHLQSIGQVSAPLSVECSSSYLTTFAITNKKPIAYDRLEFTGQYAAFDCENVSSTSSLTAYKHGSSFPVKTVDTSGQLPLSAGQSFALTMEGLADGDYDLVLTLNSAAGPVTKSVSITVLPISMPILNVSSNYVQSGKTSMLAKLSVPANAGCSFTVDASVAQADSKQCFVTMSSSSDDLSSSIDSNQLPMYSGTTAIEGDVTFSATVSRWVNSVKYDFPTITKTVTVSAPPPISMTLFGKTHLYALIEPVDLMLEQSQGKAGSVCNLFASVTDAMAMAQKGEPACIVSFTGLGELSSRLVGNQYRFNGILTSVGQQTVNYTVSRVFMDGTMITAGESHFDMTTQQPKAPSVTFSGGNLITAGQYYASNGKVTNANIAPDVKTSAALTLIVTDKQQNVTRTNLSAGSSAEIVTANLGLLEKRVIQLRLAWSAYPALYTDAFITAVGGADPATNLMLSVPRTISDTDILNGTIQIGKQGKNAVTYKPDVNGSWSIKVVATSNAQTTPYTLSDGLQTSGTGQATFTTPVAGVQYLNMTAIASLKSDIPGLNATLTSNSVKVQVIKTSPIEGTISANTSEGLIPAVFSFQLSLSPDNKAAAKSYIWQQSSDGGATWIDATSKSQQLFGLRLTETQKMQIRVHFVNVNTLEDSYSNTIEVFAYPKLTANINGPRFTTPGTPATLTGSMLVNGQPTMETVNQWTIVDSQGATTTSTGNTVTINKNSLSTVKVALKSRLMSTDPNDKSAWVYANSIVSVVSPQKPGISIAGPKVIETGVSNQFTGNVMPSWGSANSASKMMTQWTLPDGSKVDGSTLNWIAPHTFAGKPVQLIFKSWIDGYQPSTQSSTSYTVMPWRYIWPTFTANLLQPVPMAPSNYRMQVNHDHPEMNGHFDGLTYQWYIPEGIKSSSGNLDPSQSLGQLVYQGEYPIAVTVSDQRGHQTRLQKNLTAAAAQAYTVNISYFSGNQWSRAPMKNALFRANISGGHPLDSPVDQTWMIDGQVVSDNNKDRISVDIMEAGEHTISYTLNSKMGQTSGAQTRIKLNPDIPPVCTLSTSQAVGGVSVKSSCSDADGRIVAYAWTLDGKALPNQSSVITLNAGHGAKAANVGLSVQDDAGVWSSVVSILAN